MLLKPLVIFVVVVFVTYETDAHATRSTSAPIGGLFNNRSLSSSLEAFQNIAPYKDSDSKTYFGRYLASKVLDSYSTAFELCDLTSDNKGISALVDARPTDGICDTICLLCNKYNIPHLSIGWEPIESLKDNEFTLMYHPPPEIISKAFTVLSKHLGYDKFTIFYEDEGSFIRLQDVINSWNNVKEPIIFAKLDPEGDNRETFKNVFKVKHISYHILDCEVDNILKYFKEITQVNDATKYQSFILSNLDAYTINLSTIPALLANVSTLHLSTLESVDRWRDIGMPMRTSIKLETVLAADALNHLERAIKVMLQTEKASSNKELRNPPALCYQEDYSEHVWSLGEKLKNALRQTKADDGFTGNIEFDPDIGKRINFKLHYSKLNQDSDFVYVGKWDSRTNLLNTSENNVLDRASNLGGSSVVRVITRVGKPYVYVVDNPGDGPELRGYAVDLVDKIFKVIKEIKHVDLKYELKKVKGNGYGRKIEETNKWDGIIGELIEHKADVGVCDLTITSDRNAVVDFSIPFMTLGISMLVRERPPEDPKMFSFLLPLSLDVWLSLAMVFIVTSFILLICARMSQEDWVNPHPCNQNPENLQNIWSYYNCMWLSMGAIMCQGCDILPRITSQANIRKCYATVNFMSMSSSQEVMMVGHFLMSVWLTILYVPKIQTSSLTTSPLNIRAAGSRWISGMWWFFALIVTSSYTANMSTFISEGRRNDEIKDVKDLTGQNKVSYGAVKNASTYTFFEQSNETVYQKLWAVMSSAKPTVFAKDNDEGMERVKRSKGKYAFFMESTAIEFYTKRHCELKMLGSKLDSKEYGIAFPKSSPYKTLIDFAILHLQENGELDKLKTKWWEEEDNDEDCESDENLEEDNGSLKMKNTSGIFLVLGLGGILGLIVAAIDFLMNAESISVKEKISFREALISEWRASLNPKTLHKQAAPQRSAPPSTASPSPRRERSQSRAVSVLRAASSFINFDEIY